MSQLVAYATRGLRLLPCLAAGILQLAAGAPAVAHAGPEGADMVLVSGGAYQPFYKGKNGTRPIPVGSFLLDREPVSSAEFAEFIATHPRWRKSQVKPLFAESGYLAGWHGNLAPAATASEPVTSVSWFAASDYCECQGKRLPTQVEWEWAFEGVQPASGTTRVAATDGSRRADATTASLRFARGRETAAGVAFTDIWEWTSDFNALLVSNPSPDESASSLFCGDGFRATDAKDYGGFLRFSFRSSLKANYALRNLGFRCTKELP